jgi:EAL domain-containing protein (putative c-di-GMP-specific phosphodiesterase class I)
MATKDLLEALPDLILLLHRDGTVLGSYGGLGTPELKPTTDPVGKQLEFAWPASLATLIRQLTLEAIAAGRVSGASYQHAGIEYDLRVNPHGSYCAVCSIRSMLDQPSLDTTGRQDLANELPEAIAKAQISLRYVSRHDLATGRLVARVGYLRWRHPRYGEIHPLELVRLAEITGQSADLTRAALQRLQRDFAAFTPQWRKGVRISFGAPRHHILHEDFIGDIERFLADSAVPAERLELRLPVKVCFAREASDFNSLAKRGVQFVVDDLGRGMDWPLDWLSRAALHGLQLNRGWVKAMHSDPNTLNLCRAALAIAKTFALTPIAASVDEPEQRDTLLALGCMQGCGDLYRDELIPPDRLVDSRALATARPLEPAAPVTGATFRSERVSGSNRRHGRPAHRDRSQDRH